MFTWFVTLIQVFGLFAVLVLLRLGMEFADYLDAETAKIREEARILKQK